MKNEEQQDWTDFLKSKMDEEGFDYCFMDYPDWKEVKDEKFQELRANYVKAAELLRNYVENL